MSQDPVAAQIAELVAFGRQLIDAGQLTEAEHVFEGLRAIVPGDVKVNKQLGIVLAMKGAFAAATEPLLQAAAVDDSDPVIFNLLAACAFETADYPAALAFADRALVLQPAYPEAHNNRGNALLRLDRPLDSTDAFQAALRLTPRDAELHLNLGNALEALVQLPQALASIEQALALDPRLALAHAHRANILQRLRRHREALDAYDQALALDPGHVDGNWNRAICLMLLGDYPAGWAGFEWRWRLPIRKTQARDLGAPLWLGGESLQGRTILLHGEQGLGDTLQFVRYVPKVAERGARIVLEVFAPLADLLAGFPGVAEVVRRGDPLPPFDLQCPLLSLPLALGEAEPLGMPRPYVEADPAKQRLWVERLGPKRGLRVGLVCSGSATHGADANRSLPFGLMAAGLPSGPEYHLLQKEIRDADREAIAGRPDVAVWADALGDFTDTAALCGLMDVVISVDTSVAHLAGALGRPVWVLLPFEPDWRWRLEGETTPWYPQMRLYRQTVRGDWGGPLERIGQDLLGLT